MFRRTAFVVAFAIVGWLPGDSSTAPPKAKDDISVLRIPSPYTLPPASEERWFEKKRQELERYRKMLRLAYDKIGKRDPKWDEPARQSLEALAHILSHQIKPETTDSDVCALAQKAIDAGCDDPLVLYARVRFASGKYAFDGTTAILCWLKVAEGFAKDTYPPFWRVSTLTKIATTFSDFQNADDRMHCGKFGQAALTLYLAAFKLDRTSWSSDELRDEGLELQEVFARLAGNPKTAFDLFDKTLAQMPDAKVTRLQLKGGFELQEAWRVRGSGTGDTVTPEGAKKMVEYLNLAKASLAEAWKADPNDPWSPAIMLAVLKGLGGEREEFRQEVKLWFDRAMKADPNDRHACEELLDILDAKWHGSPAEVVAFGRECLKSKNVYNRIALLIAEAHLRVVILNPDREAAKRYIMSRPVRKEIDDAIAKYFQAVPDDRGEACRVAMHFYFAGSYLECWKWFEKSEDYVRATGISPASVVPQARSEMREMVTKMGYQRLPPTQFAKLSPPSEGTGKSPDRLVAEWMIEQGGGIGFTLPNIDKNLRRGHNLKDLPDDLKEPIELIDIGTSKGRKVASEMPSLAGCKKLRTVQFRGVDLRPSELKRLGDLIELTIEQTPTIDDASVAEIVRRCPNLVILKLDRTAVTDASAREIEKLSKLTHLRLWGTKISDRSIESFRKMPKLSLLQVPLTDITQAGVDRLSTALPKCIIDWNRGTTKGAP